jgi:hypothetical protein
VTRDGGWFMSSRIGSRPTSAATIGRLAGLPAGAPGPEIVEQLLLCPPVRHRGLSEPGRLTAAAKLPNRDSNTLAVNRIVQVGHRFAAARRCRRRSDVTYSMRRRSGDGLPEALLTLSATTGEVHATTSTDRHGRYRLRLPSPATTSSPCWTRTRRRPCRSRSSPPPSPPRTTSSCRCPETRAAGLPEAGVESPESGS